MVRFGRNLIVISCCKLKSRFRSNYIAKWGAICRGFLVSGLCCVGERVTKSSYWEYRREIGIYFSWLIAYKFTPFYRSCSTINQARLSVVVKVFQAKLLFVNSFLHDHVFWQCVYQISVFDQMLGLFWPR